MRALVEGIVRGYFEAERSYNGDRFISRYLQLETTNGNGEIEINKIFIPNHKDTIEFAKSIDLMKHVQLPVDFNCKDNQLFCKLLVTPKDEAF